MPSLVLGLSVFYCILVARSSYICQIRRLVLCAIHSGEVKAWHQLQSFLVLEILPFFSAGSSAKPLARHKAGDSSNCFEEQTRATTRLLEPFIPNPRREARLLHAAVV